MIPICFCKVTTPSNYFCNYCYRHLNAIFYWKLFQLLLEGIILEKLKNSLWWGILSYFDTKNQPFLHFLILPLYYFRFIIAYPFINIVVLFLFGCCRFWHHNEVWVQFPFVRWVLQDIHLLLYIHCVPISKITLTFNHYTVLFFNKIWFILLHFMLAGLLGGFW